MAVNTVRLVLVFLGALVLGLLVFYAWALQKPHNTVIPNPQLPTKQVTIGNTTVVAEVADTNLTRQTGLSGRASLAQGRAMLFVFDEAGEYGFWMKDMSFSIDIIFADDSGVILNVDSNLSPLTYEQKVPQVFYPAKPARYVLELPAGYAKKHNIAVGMKMTIH